MHETKFIHLPPRPSPVTRGLGIIAGITAISFAAAWAFEQHRKRELVRALADARCGKHPADAPIVFHGTRPVRHERSAEADRL